MKKSLITSVLSLFAVLCFCITLVDCHIHLKIYGAVHIPKGMLWNSKQNLITKLLRIYRLFSNDW